MSGESKTREVRCTNHCSKCGLHFHSVAAFDAHREGDFASNDPELGRHCVHPTDKTTKRTGVSPFVPLSESGSCNLYGSHTGVTVWTLRDSLERAREQWGDAA